MPDKGLGLIQKRPLRSLPMHYGAWVANATEALLHMAAGLALAGTTGEGRYLEEGQLVTTGANMKIGFLVKKR